MTARNTLLAGPDTGQMHSLTVRGNEKKCLKEGVNWILSHQYT